ncbi:MAG: hypothetical protein WBA83_11475 [Burkholderiaceae bacterium]
MGQHSNDVDNAFFQCSASSEASDGGSWSPELRLHLEKQCEMWANITARIESNARVLGTPEMRLYSPDERNALAAMMANMRQFMDGVNGDLGRSVEATHARLEAALAAYDAFIARSGTCL